MIAAIPVIVLVIFWLTIVPVGDPADGRLSAPTSERVLQSPYQAAQAELKVINDLRAKSTNNAAFQKWGRELMLGQVNAHLARVPVYGLTSPLAESNSIVNTFLTPEGAELWLHTKDLKHRFRYEHGVMLEALATEADITGIGHDPGKIEHFADNSGPWSKDEAAKAAENLLKRSGLNPSELGIKSAPSIRPETLKLPGTQKEITPFYTATWLGKQGEAILEIRFRRTAAGTWEPTYWFNTWRPAKEPETMSYSNLSSRFF